MRYFLYHCSCTLTPWVALMHFDLFKKPIIGFTFCSPTKHNILHDTWTSHLLFFVESLLCTLGVHLFFLWNTSTPLALMQAVPVKLSCLQLAVNRWRLPKTISTRVQNIECVLPPWKWRHSWLPWFLTIGHCTSVIDFCHCFRYGSYTNMKCCCDVTSVSYGLHFTK